MGRALNNASLGTLAGVATGNNGLITAACRDAFSKGDLVFSDYASGKVINLNNCADPLAFAAGAGFDSLGHPIQSGTATSGTAAVVFADGSYAIFAVSSASTTDTAGRVLGWRYNVHGAIVATRSFGVLTGAPADYGLTAALLANGTVAFAYRLTNGAAIVNILDANLGFINTQSIASTVVTSLAALSDNSVLVHSSTGIYKVPVSGAVTTIASLTVTSPGEDHTNGSVSNSRYNSTWTASDMKEDSTPFALTSSGLGIITNVGTGINFNKLNSDGSVRSAATTITSGLTNITKVVYATGTSNNVFWAACHNGGTTWGIVSETGTVVKAATLIASSDIASGGYGVHLRAIADANGDFFFQWSSSSGTVLNSNWVTSAAGTSKVNFPRTDATSNAAAGASRLVRLSTGIVVYQMDSGGTALLYSLFNNAGSTVVSLATIHSASGSGVKQTGTLALVVYNDTAYGYHTVTTATTFDVTGMVHTISNAGVLTRSHNYASVTTDALPIMYVDANDITVFNGQWIKRHRVSDLTDMGGDQVTTQTMPASWSLRQVVLKAGPIYISCSSSTAAAISTSAAPWSLAFWRIKAQRTTLLGVAQSSAVANDVVLVQTKGHAFTTWVGTSNFDQTANSNGPNGPKGSVSGSFITLSGN